jgi:hypothetical protein
MEGDAMLRKLGLYFLLSLSLATPACIFDSDDEEDDEGAIIADDDEAEVDVEVEEE